MYLLGAQQLTLTRPTLRRSERKWKFGALDTTVSNDFSTFTSSHCCISRILYKYAAPRKIRKTKLVADATVTTNFLLPLEPNYFKKQRFSSERKWKFGALDTTVSNDFSTFTSSHCCISRILYKYAAPRKIWKTKLVADATVTTNFLLTPKIYIYFRQVKKIWWKTLLLEIIWLYPNKWWTLQSRWLEGKELSLVYQSPAYMQ